MSSKMEIDKNCEYCGKLYTARTLYTRYCSHICNSRHYKAIKREERINSHKTIEVSQKNLATTGISNILAEIKAKDYLSITEVCAVVGVSRNTIFRWIKSSLLPTYQHGTKHLIKKEDITKIFSNGQ